jgi:hypothetical protein
MKQILETSVCHMCGEGFSFTNQPTLDRIDNDKPHTKENVKPCCLICNRFKADKDEAMRKMMIKLRQYARTKCLPTTLCQGQEHLYEMIRKGIRGGPSNVHNRYNMRGISSIKKLGYDETNFEIKVVEPKRKGIVSLYWC